MATRATIAKNKYDKTHTRQYLLKLHLVNDADIIERLASQDNMQGYIKQLIRDDIKRTRTSTGFDVEQEDDTGT